MSGRVGFALLALAVIGLSIIGTLEVQRTAELEARVEWLEAEVHHLQEEATSTEFRFQDLERSR